jgi:ribosome-associated protein
MLRISPSVTIPEAQLEFAAMRARGAGGQNVNKVASAVHLRFDIRASSLPEACKRRLLEMDDRRVTRGGIIVIRAEEYRSQERNRAAARQRLADLVRRALVPRKRRIATQPGRTAREQRLQDKAWRARIKQQRRARPDLE